MLEYTYILPIMIYPGLWPQAECHGGGPDGTIHIRSKSGWIIEELIGIWLKHFYIVYGKPQKFKPHCFDFIQFLQRQWSFHAILTWIGISSHRIQPLDTTFMVLWKLLLIKSVTSTCRRTQRSSCQTSKSFSKKHISRKQTEKGVSGFRTTRIYPLNKEVFSEEDFIGADVRVVYNKDLKMEN